MESPGYRLGENVMNLAAHDNHQRGRVRPDAGPPARHRARGLLFATVAFVLCGSNGIASPPEVTNLRLPTQTQLAWDPVGTAAGYHVYRGSLSGLRSGDYGVCLLGSLQAPMASMTDSPSVGDVHFFLVAAFDESGQGIVQRDSSGVAHDPSDACVPSRRVFELTTEVSADGLEDVAPPVNPSMFVRSGKRVTLGVFLHSGELIASAPGAGVISQVPEELPGYEGAHYDSANGSSISSGPRFRGQGTLIHPMGSKTPGAGLGFEIKDFSFGVENPTTIGSATGGAGAGKIKFNEFTIKKTSDSVGAGLAAFTGPVGSGAHLYLNFIPTQSSKTGSFQNRFARAGLIQTLIGLGGNDTFTDQGTATLYAFGGGSALELEDIHWDVWAGGELVSRLDSSSQALLSRLASLPDPAPGFMFYTNLAQLLEDGELILSRLSLGSQALSRLASPPALGAAGVALLESSEPAEPLEPLEPGLSRLGLSSQALLSDLASLPDPAPGGWYEWRWARHSGESPAGHFSVPPSVHRSRIRYDGPFGHNWDFGANSRVRPMGPDVLWHDGAGRKFKFVRLSATSFISPKGIYATLRQEPSGEFLLRHPGGLIKRYRGFDGSSTQGALLSEEDLDGDRVSYLYDAQGLLTMIVDALGRSSAFSYDAQGRITGITDHDDRTTSFEYDAAGDLVAVRTPAVTGTPNGNDFPSGKETRYTYTSGFADERLNHNLQSIVSPGAPGGLASVQVGYGTDAGLPDFDRAVSLTLGDDSVFPPTGGTLAFDYTSLNPGADPGFLDLPRRRTLVTDRNGNESEHVHNASGHLLTHIARTNRDLRPGEPDYVTERRYNADGQMVSLATPEGAMLALTYDALGADRYRRGNLIEARLIADADRGDGHGGVAADRLWSFQYEPIANRLAQAIDPRGNVSVRLFDYQEGDPAATGLSAYAALHGISLAGIPLNLGDLNGDGLLGQIAARPVRAESPRVALDPGSRQAEIEGDEEQEGATLLRYDGHGALETLVDPEGNVHTFEYYPETDPDGDGLDTPPPDDGRMLDPVVGGYLKAAILDTMSARGRDNGTDPTPAMVRHDYRYDPRGNLVRLVDGRGVATEWIHNQLDQVVEIRRASETFPATGRGEAGLTSFDFLVHLAYDADDRLVGLGIDDAGGTRNVGVSVDTLFSYDVLDNLVAVEQETAPGAALLTRLSYDANENLVRVTRPVGNADDLAWDERDLPLSSTRGAAGPRGGSPSTRSYAYDGDGGLLRIVDARGGLVDYEYDGFGRLARAVDQVGSTADFYLDPDGNLERLLLRGPVEGPTPTDRAGTDNVDLEDMRYTYDARNRLVKMDRLLFVSDGVPWPITPGTIEEGPLLPGDGRVNHILEYDRLSRLTFAHRDSSAQTRFDHDGMSRLLRVTSPDGSTTDLTYDGDGNLVETMEIEQPSAPGPPAETFFTTYFYDALGRLTTAVDNLGQTWRFVHDSLDAVVARTDPRGPLSGTIAWRSEAGAGLSVPVNGHGNVTRYAYDGAGRLIRTEIVLTATGEGDGTLTPLPGTGNGFNPDGLISMMTTWDGNSLPNSRTDDAGDVTAYTYDNLDRLVRLTADDETFAQRAYDPEDNLAAATDPIGTTVTYTNDAVQRRVRAEIAAGSGSGTTLQTFEYDGLSRLTRATDDNNPMNAADDSVVTLIHDSLGRRLGESQSLGGGAAATIGADWLADDLVTGLIYPSGRRIQYAYDAADRLVQVGDSAGAQTASFEYFGMSRIHTRLLDNGVRSTALNDFGTADIGFDGGRRPILIRHLGAGNALLAGFEYRYDRAGRRTSQRRTHHAGPVGGAAMGELYAHDSAGRLVSFQEAFLTSAHGLASALSDAQTWSLDGSNGWAAFSRMGTPFSNTPNNLKEYDEPQSGGMRTDDGIRDDFADSALTPLPDGENQAHDKNGRRTADNAHIFLWDSIAHRLVGANRHGAGSPPVARYAYDALGRRVRREVTNSGALDEVRRYFYWGAAVLEERDAAGSVAREAAYAPGTGGALWQVTPGAVGGSTANYLLLDALGSTIALTDGTLPSIVERTTYDPYGKPTFESPGNLPLTEPASGAFVSRSPAGNPDAFAGMRYDPELGARTGDALSDRGGFYHVRFRTYDPNQGRFMARHPRGAWGVRSSHGNPYTFAGNDPVGFAAGIHF